MFKDQSRGFKAAIVRKTFGFEAAKRFTFGIIIAVSQPTHAAVSADELQRLAHFAGSYTDSPGRNETSGPVRVAVLPTHCAKRCSLNRLAGFLPVFDPRPAG